MGPGQGPGGLQGQNSLQYNNFMSGLDGGQYENPDRIFTGQVTSLLSGVGGSGNRNSGYGGGGVNYGLPSTCPEGVNQNTALLATAAAIAVGAGVIYRAVTLQQGKRRRRRRAESRGVEEDGVLEMVMRGVKKYRHLEES